MYYVSRVQIKTEYRVVGFVIGDAVPIRYSEFAFWIGIRVRVQPRQKVQPLFDYDFRLNFKKKM